MQDQGLLLNYGSDGTNTISGFTQQQVGMFIASSASCRNVIDSATDFEVGVANLPVPERKPSPKACMAAAAPCAWPPA